jgi:Cu/Ag efflux protein CusF
MKKTLFAFLFLFVISAFALAQTDQQQKPEDQLKPEEQQMQPPAQEQAPAGQNQKISGVIQKVDLEKKIITLKDEQSRSTQDVDFSETTVFNKEGQSITADQLQKGDQVSLEVDAQNMVTRIEIMAPEGTTPPPEKK